MTTKKKQVIATPQYKNLRINERRLFEYILWYCAKSKGVRSIPLKTMFEKCLVLSGKKHMSLPEKIKHLDLLQQYLVNGSVVGDEKILEIRDIPFDIFEVDKEKYALRIKPAEWLEYVCQNTPQMPEEELEVMMSFERTMSIVLYKQLILHKKQGHWCCSLNNINASYGYRHGNSCNINATKDITRQISRAIDEIKPYFTKLEYRTIKKKKVVGYEFVFTPKKLKKKKKPEVDTAMMEFFDEIENRLPE